VDITRKASDNIKQDDMKIIVNNERVVISRCKDPDGFVYSQFMPGPQYGDFIQATKPPCWCAGVGEEPSLLVAFAFDPKELAKGPTDDIQAAKQQGKKPKEGGYLASQFLSAFGVNFQIHISEMMVSASNPPASNPPASNPPASNPPASNPPLFSFCSHISISRFPVFL